MDRLTDNQLIVLLCAFRYALGRISYVVPTVVNEIIRNWESIPMFQQQRVKTEIQDAIDSNKAGMQCDIDIWTRILELEYSNE